MVTISIDNEFAKVGMDSESIRNVGELRLRQAAIGACWPLSRQQLEEILRKALAKGQKVNYSAKE